MFYITGFTLVGTLGIQFDGLLVMFIVSRYCCSFCVIRQWNFQKRFLSTKPFTHVRNITCVGNYGLNYFPRMMHIDSESPTYIRMRDPLERSLVVSRVCLKSNFQFLRVPKINWLNFFVVGFGTLWFEFTQIILSFRQIYWRSLVVRSERTYSQKELLINSLIVEVAFLMWCCRDFETLQSFSWRTLLMYFGKAHQKLLS